MKLSWLVLIDRIILRALNLLMNNFQISMTNDPPNEMLIWLLWKILKWLLIQSNICILIGLSFIKFNWLQKLNHVHFDFLTSLLCYYIPMDEMYVWHGVVDTRTHHWLKKCKTWWGLVVWPSSAVQCSVQSQVLLVQQYHHSNGFILSNKSFLTWPLRFEMLNKIFNSLKYFIWKFLDIIPVWIFPEITVLRYSC